MDLVGIPSLSPFFPPFFWGLPRVPPLRPAVKPEVISFTAAMRACEQAQRWEKALKLCQAMRKSLWESVVNLGIMWIIYG